MRSFSIEELEFLRENTRLKLKDENEINSLRKNAKTSEDIRKADRREYELRFEVWENKWMKFWEESPDNISMNTPLSEYAKEALIESTENMKKRNKMMQKIERRKFEVQTQRYLDFRSIRSSEEAKELISRGIIPAVIEPDMSQEDWNNIFSLYYTLSPKSGYYYYEGFRNDNIIFVNFNGERQKVVNSLFGGEPDIKVYYPEATRMRRFINPDYRNSYRGYHADYGDAVYFLEDGKGYQLSYLEDGMVYNKMKSEDERRK